MFKIILYALTTALRSRRKLALENLALRHQLEVLQRNAKRPGLKPSDRAIWAILSHVLPSWRRHRSIVQPDTVVRWQRTGWRLFWRRKSNPGKGRPRVSVEVRTLIRRMSVENPLWGAPRIHGELLKLGYEICETTIGKYMIRRPGPPSQTWKTFIRNHMTEIVAVDFFTVPAVTFRTFYVFLILSLDRRRIIHFNVTSNPTADWTRTRRNRESFRTKATVLSTANPSSVAFITATIAKQRRRCRSDWTGFGRPARLVAPPGK